MGDIKSKILDEMIVDHANALEKNFELAKKFIGITKEGVIHLKVNKNKFRGNQLITLYLIGKVYAKAASLSKEDCVSNKELMNEIGLPEGSVKRGVHELNTEGKIRKDSSRGMYRIPLNLIEKELMEIDNFFSGVEDKKSISRHKRGKINKAKSDTPSFNMKKVKRPKTQPSTLVPVPFDIRKGDDSPSLRDFYEEKKPSTHQERMAVYVYYINKYAKVDNITEGHIVYAYKATRQKRPLQIHQLVLDTKNGPGHISYDPETKTILLSDIGEDFVDYDLPKKDGDNRAKN